jgi:uncharacterized protein (TIGR02246 family)
MGNSKDELMAADVEIRALYQRLLGSWNQRDAAAMAGLFAEDGHSIGFDGSQMSGRAEITTTLQQIFTDHITGVYVGKVREVRPLSTEVAVLRAVVGMIPPGQTDLAPQLNAIQTLVVTKQNGNWEITLLQNTPAQFHGRPELVQQLTDELRQLL